MTYEIKEAAIRALDEIALRRKLQEQRVSLGLEPPPPPTPPPTPEEEEAERLKFELLLSRLALSRAQRAKRHTDLAP